MKNYILLSAAAMMMLGFAPQASAMDDAHAGKAMVEATAEASAEATDEMKKDEDCAEHAMKGDEAVVDSEAATDETAKDDCISKKDDAAEVEAEATVAE